MSATLELIPTPCPHWCAGHSEIPEGDGDRLHSRFWDGIVELSATDSEPAPLVFITPPERRGTDPSGGDYTLGEAEQIARDILAAVAAARDTAAGTEAR